MMAVCFLDKLMAFSQSRKLWGEIIIFSYLIFCCCKNFTKFSNMGKKALSSLYVKAWRQNTMWGHDEGEKKWQIESDMLTNVTMKKTPVSEWVNSLGGALFFYFIYQNIYSNA